MKNPLRKRILRELKSDFGKYLVIFVLMVVLIGVTSGFLVAGDSMLKAYNEGFEKYNIEDGRFETADKMNKAQLKRVNSLGITVYELFCQNVKLGNGSTLRIYPKRDVVNLESLMEGEWPAQSGEIAIDRMYAVNNNISCGDVITSEDGREYTVTGYVALSDYSCLFENNNDSMFDATLFGVAIVTPEEFAGYDEESLTYTYAWKYDSSPADDIEAADMAEDLKDALSDEVTLEDFVPEYLNNAIIYTGDDMGQDKVLMEAFMYIIIVIIAFVFAITINNTIATEATVIGTLRASGYSVNELVGHYMAAPILVTVISAIVGNIWGYTQMKDMIANLYYGSYSLPTFVTVLNPEAFLKTTIMPVIMMIVINYVVLRTRLTISPINFIRRNLSRSKAKRALKLNKHIPFFGRFRLRVIIQNLPNYIVMLIGIFFANVILIYGMALGPVLTNYQDMIPDTMFCNYTYILQMPSDIYDEDHKLKSMIAMLGFYDEVETDNEDAEKFTAYNLETLGENGIKAEEVTFYGIEDESRYIKADLGEGDAYISSAMAEKYSLEAGDEVTLKEKYASDEYTIQITGIYDYIGGIAIFMDKDYLNEYFDLGEDYFCGYLSDTEITDIDEQYIGQTISIDSLTKITRQIMTSLGGMATIVDVFALAVFVVLVYLLSKVIIEKNAQNISMAKILGYTNFEIGRLYIIPTSIMVIIFLAITVLVAGESIIALFKLVIAMQMSGWIIIEVPREVYIETFLLGVATYAIVAILELIKIRKVPMEEALKNAE